MNDVIEPIVDLSSSENSACINALLATVETPKNADDEINKNGETTVFINSASRLDKRPYKLEAIKQMRFENFLKILSEK